MGIFLFPLMQRRKVKDNHGKRTAAGRGQHPQAEDSRIQRKAAVAANRGKSMDTIKAGILAKVRIPLPVLPFSSFIRRCLGFP